MERSVCITCCIYVCLISLSTQAQSHGDNKLITVAQNSKETVFRLAGDYSENNDVVTIATLRGTAFKKEYDEYLKILSFKLDSMNVPHKIFQKFDDTPGTNFAYFVDNDFNGPFYADQLAALLPRIKRKYNVAYKARSDQ